MLEQLAVEIERVPLNGDHALIVALRGDYHFTQSENIEEVVLNHIEEQTGAVGIDLSGLRTIDSYGLGTLAALATRLLSRGTEFAVFGAGTDLESVFKMTHLDGMFVMMPTREQALDAFRSARS